MQMQGEIISSMLQVVFQTVDPTVSFTDIICNDCTLQLCVSFTTTYPCLLCRECREVKKTCKEEWNFGHFYILEDVRRWIFGDARVVLPSAQQPSCETMQASPPRVSGSSPDVFVMRP